MIQKNTESEMIYEALKNDIILQVIKPNTKLSEVQLAERFGTSRAPVQRALRQLSDEGLVDVRPQSGTFVTAVSFEKSAHIRQIRVLLEPEAARIAAAKIPAKDLMLMELQFQRLEEPLEGHVRYLTVTEVDEAMHDLILDYCGNPELADTIRRLRPAMQRMTLYNLTHTPERSYTVVVEMKRVFAALKARDGEKAYAEMRDHLLQIQTAKVKTRGG